jgi:hypothetical protein
MSRLGIHRDPDNIASIQSFGHDLPRLVALDRPGIGLAMQIALPDATQELIEGRGRRSGRLEDQLSMLEA